MIRIVLFVFLSAFSSFAFSVYWTIQPTGTMAKADGQVAVNFGNNIPTGPNPSDSQWEPCSGNWLYFHKTHNGQTVSDSVVSNMLAIALSAYKTNQQIRVAIERGTDGRCYTSQIFE